MLTKPMLIWRPVSAIHTNLNRHPQELTVLSMCKQFWLFLNSFTEGQQQQAKRIIYKNIHFRAPSDESI